MNTKQRFLRYVSIDTVSDEESSFSGLIKSASSSLFMAFSFSAP